MLSPPRSVELRADERLRLPMGGRLDRRLILRPVVRAFFLLLQPATTLSEYRIGQDVNSRIQAAG